MNNDCVRRQARRRTSGKTTGSMHRKLVINETQHETRVALLEDGNIVELFIERGDESDIAGNIYKGRVQRVLPGIQAAFVDIGLNQAAFIYVDDVLGDHVVIVPRNEPAREEIGAWLRERGAHEVATVLGELRVPVSKEDLAALTARFAEATWQVRPPNLDDLFIALARRNGRFE